VVQFLENIKNYILADPGYAIFTTQAINVVDGTSVGTDSAFPSLVFLFFELFNLFKSFSKMQLKNTAYSVQRQSKVKV